LSKNKFLVTAMLMTLLLLTFAANVNAQTQATVVVLTSIGGTTDPAAGTYNYADGTSVTFTATALTGFVFQEWIVSTDQGSNTATDATITIPVTGGVTYTFQPIFAPIQVPPNGNPIVDYSTAAIVVVLTSSGGTTSPLPGTYAINDASQLELTATAAEGWKFDHWAITGYPIQGAHGSFPFTPNPTDNHTQLTTVTETPMHIKLFSLQLHLAQLHLPQGEQHLPQQEGWADYQLNGG
jgi:hypothetical protein